MDMKALKDEADANLTALAGNTYVGRGLVVGLDEKGENLIQVYWIMGRSTKSRNRVFGCDQETGRVFTEVADPALLDEKDDLSLIIYNAMLEFSCIGTRWYVVSNGKQTDNVVKGYSIGRQFREVMDFWEYEHDPPNFTPRITAISRWYKDKPFVSMSLLRKSPWSNACEPSLYNRDLHPGFGYCLTTYSGDGSPLPSFHGEPYLLPLRGGIRSIANTFFGLLNYENKVSLAVKFIPKQGSSKIFTHNQYLKKV